LSGKSDRRDSRWQGVAAGRAGPGDQVFTGQSHEPEFQRVIPPAAGCGEGHRAQTWLGGDSSQARCATGAKGLLLSGSTRGSSTVRKVVRLGATTREGVVYRAISCIRDAGCEGLCSSSSGSEQPNTSAGRVVGRPSTHGCAAEAASDPLREEQAWPRAPTLAIHACSPAWADRFRREEVGLRFCTFSSCPRFRRLDSTSCMVRRASESFRSTTGQIRSLQGPGRFGSTP